MVERGPAHREARRRFGTILRRVRQNKHLKISVVAERSGYSERHVGDVERGAKSPTLEFICAVAEALGVQPSGLFALVDNLRNDGYSFDPNRDDN